MAKFGRAYNLTWIPPEEEDVINVTMPLTMQFNVNRSTMSSVNSAQIKIYNLDQKTRSRMFQDRFDLDLERRNSIILQAGYKNLSTIFQGDVFEAYSMRQGTEIITHMDCRDGGLDSSGTLTNTAIQKNTDIREMLSSLISGFQNLKEGTIGNIEGSIKRPVVLDGNTFELIKKYSDDNVFIDLEKVNILKDNETIEGVVPLINSETGLLNAPRRRGAMVEIETIFEPRIVMGQILAVESKIQPEYDGQYKVIGVNHSGIISGAVGGQCKSKFTLLIGSKEAGGFQNVG